MFNLHQYQSLNLEKIDPYGLYLFDDILDIE